MGQEFELENETLSFTHDDKSVNKAPEAYERLLLDALSGNQTNFTHWTELAQTWQFVDVIRKAWDQMPNMPTYAAGTMGPVAAAALLEADGHHWVFQPTKSS